METRGARGDRDAMLRVRQLGPAEALPEERGVSPESPVPKGAGGKWAQRDTTHTLMGGCEV